MTLPEILQASELAVVSDDGYAWPDGSIEPLGSEGVLLNGSTLSALGIKHVKTSQHSFLKDQYEQYDGFKIGGEPIVLSKVGTQPRSASVADNQLITLSTPGIFSLYRNTDGTVRVGNETIGAALSAPLSTRQRNISFIIVHICGAGGGGGGGGGVNPGKGGGSGSILVALIDIRSFSRESPLRIKIGAGGSGGEGKGVGEDGEDGEETYLWSSLPGFDQLQAITVYPGEGGAGGNGQPGSGGGFPAINDEWASLVKRVAYAPGSPGINQNGGPLAVFSYIDPNPGEKTVNISQSFLGDVGVGGNGGALYTDGTNGKNSSVCIYY